MQAFDLAARRKERRKEQDFSFYRVHRFVLHPAMWKKFPKPSYKLNWKRIKFTSANARKVPADKNGIYSFVARPGIANHPAVGYLLYVGKAKDQGLRARYKQYLSEEKKSKRREHIVQMITKWPEHLYFYYAEVSTQQAIGPLEDELIMAYLPPHNRQFPATIRKTMKRIFS